MGFQESILTWGDNVDKHASLLSVNQGMGDKLIVRNPAAGGFGEWRGEPLSVVLIEGIGLGDKGVEIKGGELIGGKR